MPPLSTMKAYSVRPFAPARMSPSLDLATVTVAVGLARARVLGEVVERQPGVGHLLGAVGAGRGGEQRAVDVAGGGRRAVGGQRRPGLGALLVAGALAALVHSEGVQGPPVRVGQDLAELGVGDTDLCAGYGLRTPSRGFLGRLVAGAGRHHQHQRQWHQHQGGNRLPHRALLRAVVAVDALGTTEGRSRFPAPWVAPVSWQVWSTTMRALT